MSADNVAVIFKKEYAEVAQRVSDMMGGSLPQPHGHAQVVVIVPQANLERILDAVAA